MCKLQSRGLVSSFLVENRASIKLLTTTFVTIGIKHDCRLVAKSSCVLMSWVISPLLPFTIQVKYDLGHSRISPKPASCTNLQPNTLGIDLKWGFRLAHGRMHGRKVLNHKPENHNTIKKASTL